MMEIDTTEAPLVAPQQMRELHAQCESPIEELMGAALIRAAGTTAVWVNDPQHGRMVQFYTATPEAGIAFLAPQSDIWARGRRYRLDFLVGFGTEANFKAVAVECDGHDFHDRTKEQASADRARDRAVQAEGVLVARFTGADIHADALACAREVWEMVGLFPKRPAHIADEVEP
jgi:hypothetical protein